MRIVAAPDKFRGTATAAEVAAAIAAAAESAGHECAQVPMSDGGEGVLEAFGGANRTSTVTGPSGVAVEAAWRLDDGIAVIESAMANGLLLAGGKEQNDCIRATSAGVGQLIRIAIDSGALRIVVGVGGSASTDGGLPAVDAAGRLDGIPVEVCCDVQTRFVDAARDFAPQKGATAAQVVELTERLRGVARTYRDRFGVDVTALPGSGAAGGLAGGLAAAGASLVPGFATIAAHVGLEARVADADLVITGEGRFDQTSLQGKVVGGVREMALRHGKRVFVIAGSVADGFPDDGVVSLVARFGERRAMNDTVECVREVALEVLSA